MLLHMPTAIRHPLLAPLGARVISQGDQSPPEEGMHAPQMRDLRRGIAHEIDLKLTLKLNQVMLLQDRPDIGADRNGKTIRKDRDSATHVRAGFRCREGLATEVDKVGHLRVRPRSDQLIDERRKLGLSIDG